MARNRYDVDEVLEDKFDLNQLGRLIRYIAPYKKKMMGITALMMCSSALTMSVPIFLQNVMDKSIPAGDMKSIVFYAFLTFLIALFSALAMRIKIKTMSVVGQSIIHNIRSDLFCHLQELPFSYYDDRPHGKIQVRVVNYVNRLSDLLSNGIVNTFTDLCNLIFILIFMFVLNVRLTLICLTGLPVLAIVIIFIKRKQRRAWQIQSNKQSNLNAYIAESINGIRVTQSFVREKENTGIFNQLSKSYRKSWMKAVMFNFTMGPSIDIISSVTTAFLYILGVRWILAPDAFPMPPIKGKVEFEGVSFEYEPGHRILDGISFSVQPGETYAIVGPTGAGKTTIVNLLSRFYNVNSGRILIDGTDISRVTLHSLRSQMGIMMQDSFIFSGTIMDNIRYGNRDASDAEVIQAAKTVCAHDFIMEMEHGYETEVNERGSRLSAGQRQLISFARALLADPKILILDEATSSIDTETEIILQKGLAHLLAGRTSFIIAHRLSTIKNADCILYVDKGGIVEKGNHEELMALQGEYYKLYMSQYDFLKQ